MTGNIIKRGKRSYLLRLSLGNDPVTGKRIRYTRTVHGTRREAERALRDWIDHYESGRLPTGDRVSLNQYLEEWLEVACKQRVSPRTYADYRADLERHVTKTIGGMPLGKVTVLDIQGLYSDMLKRGLTAGTIRRLHAPLSQAFRQAVRWRKIPFNPAVDVELPRTKAGVKKPVRPMTTDEANRFLEAAIQSPWPSLFEVALLSGMRPGEYLGLTWDCVDWNALAVRVEKAVVRPKGEKAYLGPPKTKKSRRSIPLPQQVMDGLRDHRICQNEERLRQGPDWSGELNLVFPDSSGGIWDYSNFVQRAFKPTLKQAGLQGFSPYSLRHTCATLLLLKNEHPKVVSERLGHSTIALTLDTYSHVLPTMQQGASDKLADIFFGA